MHAKPKEIIDLVKKSNLHVCIHDMLFHGHLVLIHDENDGERFITYSIKPKHGKWMVKERMPVHAFLTFFIFLANDTQRECEVVGDKEFGNNMYYGLKV